MNHRKTPPSVPILFLFAASLCTAKAAEAGAANVALNRAAYQSSAINYDNVAHLATDGSSETFWQSQPEDRPWIYVDLGDVRRISGIRLDWGDLPPTGCAIQVSAEAGPPARWTDIAHLAGIGTRTSSIDFPPVQARFVRMIADPGGAPSGCRVAEFAVLGTPPPAPPPVDLRLPPPNPDGRMTLDGAGWELQSLRRLHDTGETISQPAFATDGWLPAKVPGTVLHSYLLAGAVPDPDFGDQQRLVSESFFQNDFWYRREFVPPSTPPGRHHFLNFAGINWKAEVYLNGAPVGHIDGAFQRGSFDVTGKLLPGQRNALAVLVHRCPHPGPTNEKSLAHMSHNGGVLGLDSPTFVASQGWNWMPSVRGRNIGLWDHVYLEETGPIVLVDPFVHTTVAKDLREADVTVEVTVRNLEDVPVRSVLSGHLDTRSFSQEVALAPREIRTLRLDKSVHPPLALADPPLWWPNGYGGQPLQRLALGVAVEGVPSAARTVSFGVRELGYDTSNGILKLSCNGRPIQLNGGNWGMDEAMLRYEASDYDIAVRLHQAMNMVMIRNWVGQIGKEEFFDACDKYGLLVWNDFWLANPADGPNPEDDGMFMANVRDRIARLRNHPSLALYCGRNEGNPPKGLDQGMAAATASLDGTRYYIPNSASGLVAGHGPYEPKADKWYFQNRGVTLHSELGLVCVPTADTMRRMMPAKDLWPISDLWGLHDFAQPRDRVYVKRINDLYGPSGGLDEFCEKAQLQNWENAKAMFEAWRSNSGSGGLAWMSHPAWPSLICQFYDYYLNPTGAYFGARIANEPLHILWDAATDTVKVANNTGQSFTGLHAEAWIYNLDGMLQSHQETLVAADATGRASDCFTLASPPGLSRTHFIKLKLTNGGKVASENFYWRGLEGESYLDLNTMPKVTLRGSLTTAQRAGITHGRVHLENPTDNVALMVCLKAVRSTAPEQRVLPIFYDKNYVSLLPHEKLDLQLEYSAGLPEDIPAKIVVGGWNVQAMELSE